MRGMRRQYGILVVLCGVVGWAGSAAADVTTERSASILVWPKVIADGTRDTMVQLTNTSNGLVRAHCFYVDGAPADPTQEPGPLNPPLWQEVDFTISLTRQQPTQWTVSRGRPVNPLDPTCSDEPDCQNAGIDPGLIPPVVPDFTGELKCVEIDLSGAPLSGNHLLGNATIVNGAFATGYEGLRIFLLGGSKYNAIGFLGEENNGDGILVLGGGQCSEGGGICSIDEDCGDSGPCVREYNACPETWIVNHLADAAPDPVLDDTLTDGDPVGDPIERAFVENEITVVPCTQNFETQIPTTVTLQFLTTNEFENRFSTSTSVTCWANLRLEDFGAPALTFAGQPPDPSGTSFLQTRIRPAAATPFGVIMVAEHFHVAKSSIFEQAPELNRRNATTTAANVHIEGERLVPDLITIPNDQLMR